jgi:hypothetical protein
MRFRTSRSTLVVGLMTVLLSLAVPANADEASDPILDDLVTPLGLALGNDGSIYVAQSFAGTLTQVRKGTESNLFEGAGVVTGVEANGRGNLSYLLNAELVVRTPNGKTRTLANLFDYEAANNPDESNSYGFQGLSDECAAQVPDFVGGGYPFPGIVDSNPYAVELMPDGDRVVADAGGNTLVGVTPDGVVSTVAVLPPRPATINAAAAAAFGLPPCTIGETFNFDFVPTDVELGPDGMLYVTSLPGGPEGESPLGPLGAVFKVNPSTGAITEVATGFAGATDLAVTKNGTIYVTELFGNQVSMVSGGGPVPVASMAEPVAIEYAKDTLYVASGVFGGPGQVVTLLP